MKEELRGENQNNRKKTRPKKVTLMKFIQYGWHISVLLTKDMEVKWIMSFKNLWTFRISTKVTLLIYRLFYVKSNK